MSPSKINDITQLTLKTKQIKLETNGVELLFNFAEILNNKEIVYINATTFMKAVKGENRQIQDYFKTKPTKKYIEALEKYLINDSGHYLEKGLFYKKAGRYGGTWLHRKLFLNFARWLSPEFEIICDQILEQVFSYADELRSSRYILREMQKPLNDIIKEYLVDTGIKGNIAYTQFATQIKRFVGAPDERDTYTVEQLKTARKIMDEYRAMIVHGGKTSLGEMNKYIKDTDLNLAWVPKNKKTKGDKQNE